MPPNATILSHSETQVVIRCPYCKQKHTHGKVSGQRQSHCNKGEYSIKL